jgi:lincosamide nucleotidyltransferase A/C/D/E
VIGWHGPRGVVGLVHTRTVTESVLSSTDWTEVRSVLGELQRAGCRCWVAGGWGVDALLGRQTRPHRDLDLAVDADHEAVALQVLSACGYQLETDWRPVRVELVAPGRGWVDLHPVRFDEHGNGRQAGPNGSHFDYPAAAFTHGAIGGVPVPCLSRRQQLRFHQGYEPRAVDLHDLQILQRLDRA